MAGSPTPPSIGWLQANLNHCRAAQDLLAHTAVEHEVGLCIVAEPYAVPNSPRWAKSTCGSAAIWCRELPRSPPFSALRGGVGYAATRWGELTAVAVYFPPRRALAEFEGWLDALRDFVAQQHPRPVIVAGDFNVGAQSDGSLVDTPHGRALQRWTAVLGLWRLGQGPEDTCVKQRGGSIVDHAFATPAAEHLVSARHVMEVETLSDHRYILMSVSTSMGRHPGRPGVKPPRWVLRNLNEDVLRTAAEAVAWSEPPTGPCPDVEGEAVRFRDNMTRICDAGMPRAGPVPPRRAVSWWSRDLAALRAACHRSRREYARARRAGQEAEAGLLYGVYRTQVKSLQKAIAVAKIQAWEEFVATLDEDPWGRPYKWVMSKLRPWAPPLVESMEPPFLDRVLDALFPADAGGGSAPGNEPSDPTIWSDELGVSGDELAGAMKRLGAKNTAPGPDGIPGRAWVLVQDILGDRLRQLYDSCLQHGRFPPAWKRARLVLLRKEGKSAESPSAYRPICLLDEAGKLFERIIAARLAAHLSQEGPDLADSQFGFRAGRSTVDAIDRVRLLAEESATQRGCMLAVSLDIANAFNTLPWDRIRSALEHHQVPAYLRAVIGDYLRDRWIEWIGRDGNIHRRGICCGVPQGSVLGPVLWNIAYNSVLRTVLPRGVSVICYADDTLIIARGTDWRRTNARAEEGAARVVHRIQALGLRVAVEKTEAMHFCPPRVRRPPRTRLRIGGASVEVKSQMKYLGLVLDAHWHVEAHFERLAPRLLGCANALKRILPNVGGPRIAVRRLHAGVVRSIALYGAPVWARDLRASPRAAAILRRAGRLVSIRVARAYRTISGEAAHLLAGIPPMDLLAEMFAVVYYRKRVLLQGFTGSRELRARAVKALKCQARQSMLQEWQRRLAEHNVFGQRTVGAILPHFDAWLDGGFGKLSYHLTQVLTGHGCFGEYLCRIGKETTPRCHHCGAARDTAQHTLEACPAFEGERGALRAVVGGDLSLPAVVAQMIGSDRSWEAVSSFCSRVMRAKEEAERERRPRTRRGRLPASDDAEEEEAGAGDAPPRGGPGPSQGRAPPRRRGVGVSAHPRGGVG